MVEGQRPVSAYTPSLQVGPPAPVSLGCQIQWSQAEAGCGRQSSCRANLSDSALGVLFKGINDF